MASSRHRSPAPQVVGALAPLSRRTAEFERERSHSRRGLYLLVALHRPRVSLVLLVHPRGRADGRGRPVDGDGGQQLIFGEASFDVAIAVAPGAVLLHYPGGETDGRVVQAVGESLRLCALHVRVGALILLPLLALPHVGLLGLCQRCSPLAEVGHRPRDRREMDADHAVGVAVAQVGGYACADVAAVRGEAGVVEYLSHQLFPERCRPGDFDAGLGGVVREAEAGQRWSDHVEGISRIAAVGRGIGEQRDELVHLEERPWPAVRDDERHRVGTLSSLVDEVYPQASDRRLVVAE